MITVMIITKVAMMIKILSIKNTLLVIVIKRKSDNANDNYSEINDYGRQ